MVSCNRKLTYERLHEVLCYSPKSGVFYWAVDKKYDVGVGSIAGSNSNGYIIIAIDGKNYLAHRLAWFYTYGYLPENQIDHINRIRNDNRIMNLREVSPQCNVRNSNQRCDNTSGVCGVVWNKRLNKWLAQIGVSKKFYHIGVFEDFEEAVCARLAAEQCLGWSGCDSNSDAYLFVKNMIRL